MVRSIRCATGTVFLVCAFLFMISNTGQSVIAEDDSKAGKKEDKEIQMPKMPEGAKPKWDYESVEEKFTVVKGSINADGEVYFLLELKEDMTSIPVCQVIFTDSEGVKFLNATAFSSPGSGKKGDRVRLVFSGCAPESYKTSWVKATKVQIVAK